MALRHETLDLTPFALYPKTQITNLAAIGLKQATLGSSPYTITL